MPAIRHAVPADAPAIHRLICALAEYEKDPGAVKATPESLCAQMESPQPPFECLLAEDGREAVGFALFFQSYSTWRGRPGMWLEDLFVLPSHRRHGLGRRLLARLARICAERGYGRLEWNVLDWNEPAINFYKKLGAQPLSEWTMFRLCDAPLSALAKEAGEPLEAPHEIRYERLFGEELQARIAEKPLAWVPLGILERHSEHLPWGLDAQKAHGVCLHLARRLGGVVLPPTHLAGVHEPWHADERANLSHQAEVGDWYLRPETFRALLDDTVAGLSNIGFRTIVLYSGHYPKLQVQILREAAEAATQRGPARALAFHEPDALGEGDHAGKWETSLHLALGGEARMDRIHPEQADVLGHWFSHSPPMGASAELGRAGLETIVRWFVGKL